MFRFAHIEMLYLLLLVPVLVGLFYYGRWRRRKKIEKLGERRLVESLMPEVSNIRPVIKFYISLLAVMLLVFVAAGPQYGSKQEKVKSSGIELMVCVDVSNSMLAEDIKPNRMAKAKFILTNVIEKLSNNKVGIVVFAGESFVQMPLTTDIRSAKMFLNNIDPGMIPVQGTDVSSAINMSMDMFTQEAGVSRSIVIITDGEDHVAAAVEAARRAHEMGVTVNVLGVGTPDGAPIPVKGGNNFKKDKAGNVVTTKLNEQMCADIALAGGGIYVRADNASLSVDALRKSIDKMQKSDMEVEVYSNYMEQFTPFAVIALLLILIEMCVLDKKNPLLKNFKLF